jgi:hypothetical protein
MTKPPEVTVTLDRDKRLYVAVDGRRIAKRSSGESWIILEPGWRVRGWEPRNYDNLEVEYDPETKR